MNTETKKKKFKNGKLNSTIYKKDSKLRLSEINPMKAMSVWHWKTNQLNLPYEQSKKAKL